MPTRPRIRIQHKANVVGWSVGRRKTNTEHRTANLSRNPFNDGGVLRLPMHQARRTSRRTMTTKMEVETEMETKENVEEATARLS
ncbi:hypothetical protein ACLKA7_014972 [Drosophila subpalustris]